jgi:serine protease Do
MREFAVVIVLSLAGLPQANCAAWEPGQAAIEIEHGTGYLGVGLLDIDEQRAKELHLNEVRGAEVCRVDPGSPAEKAGVHPGDVLVALDGRVLDGTYELGRLVQETPPGRHAKLKIWRDGKTIILSVTIEARKSAWSVPSLPEPNSFTVPIPDWGLPDPMLAWKSGMIGVECEPLSSQLADYFGVKHGVLVRTVIKNAPAERAGIKAGDVITRVGDRQVNSPFDLTSSLRNRSVKTVALGVTRERKEITINVTTEELTPAMQPAAQSVAVQP